MRGVKENPAEWGDEFPPAALLARGAIHRVANDGASQRRKMNADLVSPARVQVRFDQRKSLEPKTCAPIRAGGAPFAAARSHSGGPAQIARDGEIDDTLLAFHFSVQEREIRFLDEPIAKILGELGVSLVVQSNHNDAGSVFVQPMHDSRTQRSAHGGQSPASTEAMK